MLTPLHNFVLAESIKKFSVIKCCLHIKKRWQFYIKSSLLFCLNQSFQNIQQQAQTFSAKVFNPARGERKKDIKKIDISKSHYND